MRLESAETHRLSLPLNRVYRLAGTETVTMESVLVAFRMETGERGIGTADPVPGHPIPDTAGEIYDDLSQRVLPALVGAPPTSTTQLARQLDELDGMENAKCAAEMAYLDLLGRRRGQSLADLLGGRVRDEVYLNAWVGIDSADSMAAEAERWNARSFESLKMKTSGDPSSDISRIRAVCEAVGDEMQIRIDANEGYETAADALEVIEAVDDLPIEHFEQPVPRTALDTLKEVTDRSAIPILADESVVTKADAAEIFGRGIADKSKFKILQSAGVLPVQEALDVADGFGGSCILGHGFCAAPAASAELQLAASHDNVPDPVETVGELKIENSPFESSWTIDDGCVRPSDVPGLGVELRREDLDRYVLESAEISETSQS